MPNESLADEFELIAKNATPWYDAKFFAWCSNNSIRITRALRLMELVESKHDKHGLLTREFVRENHARIARALRLLELVESTHDNGGILRGILTREPDKCEMILVCAALLEAVK